ncbi:MAG TPA: DUF1631 family protein, partial [Thiolapillus brandeum]|nr:DUF1631 family protein [Thiolapillus brandeum]
EIHISEESDSLELVKQDVLEEDLVVMRVIHYAENRHLFALKTLTSLLATIIPNNILKDAEIPVSPNVMSVTLHYVLREWTGDLQAKLSIYEVFGKHCLNDLEKLYPKLINLLEKAGLTPAQTPISQWQKRPKNSQITSRSRIMDEGSLFGIVELLRQLQEEQRKSLGLAEPGIVHFPPEWPVASPKVITNVIEAWQAEFSVNPPEDIAQARATQNFIKEQLLNRLEKTVADRKSRLQQVDRHIIDVVNMLFDYVLDDPIIPVRMKLLLVRLQMPVLRIAMEDKTFLTDRSHVVRVLLNNLSATAARWADVGDCAEKGIYGRIEEVVETILDNPESKLDLWIDVSQEFDAYIQNEERGARVAEERLSHIIKGKERLALARKRVDEQLAKLLPAAIPAPVYQIIDEVWRDVMTLILLREGKESSEWKYSVRVVERLLDSIVPRIEAVERQAQIAEIPKLLADLRAGFSSVSYDSTRTTMMLKQLQHCHVTALRGMQPATMKYDPKDRLSFVGNDIEDILEDENIRVVDALKQGQWIAWNTYEGTELRGKLSWRSEVTDLLLFVDLRGRQVAEMSSSELADLLRRGQAKLLTGIDSPMIERALAAIYRTLTRQLPTAVLPA